jgi:hypothetical protein
MDPVVESALISAVGTVVGVGGTVAVAIVGFRIARSSNQAALDTVRDTNKATLDATREGQLADRYSRAIEQLGSDTIDVTIGGIYALERIARDSPVYHPTVMEVLSACIREHSQEQWPKPGTDVTTPKRSTRPDIQAALTVIGRRDVSRDQQRIDLRKAQLPGADFSGAHLSGVDLSGADLTRANFLNADLSGANISFANLNRAVFIDANLRTAILSVTHLDGAYFMGADLTGAGLTNAYLTGTFFTGANLAGADLRETDLTSANLTYADLRATEDIMAVGMAGQRRGFSDAADLSGAVYDGPTPEGWVNDSRSGQLRRADAESKDCGT